MTTLVTLDQAKAQLNILAGDAADDVIIGEKLAAAEGHVQRLLGYTFASAAWTAETLPGEIREAVLQLMAHWYENREAVAFEGTGREVPLSVREVVQEWREWSF